MNGYGQVKVQVIFVNKYLVIEKSEGKIPQYVCFNIKMNSRYVVYY